MKGILDPEGKELNPLNGEKYTENYKKYSMTSDNPFGAPPWTKFPVYNKRKEIIKIIENNNVILVVSGTGSGKSVLVPKFVLHTLDYKGKVILTNPKTLATQKNAEYAAVCMDVKVGDEVGYQYRGAPSDSHSSKTKLLFSTDGTVIAQLTNRDPLLKEYSAVIIDEAHERGVNIDVLLLLLKRVLLERKDFKLIIMSATINKEIFSKYFNLKGLKFKEIDVGSIPNYPIKEIFLKEKINDVVAKMVDIIINILNTTDEGEILGFITGLNQGRKVCELLEKRQNELKNDRPFCTLLASKSNTKDKLLATDEELYKKEELGTRKIVMATNIAESSVTIKGIKYVLENGFANVDRYNPNKMSRELNLNRITKAQAKQRRGRSGRTQPGICYNLYTEKEYKDFEDYPRPDIKKSDLTEEILTLLNLKDIQSVSKLIELLSQLIEVPNTSYVVSGIENLKSIRAISKDRLTKMGYAISKIRKVNPFSGFAIIKAIKYGVLDEVAIICAMIEEGGNRMDIFFNQIKSNKKNFLRNKEKVLEIHLEFYSEEGDTISLLNLYNAYKSAKEDNPDNIQNWCRDHYINFNKISKIKKIVDDIKNDTEKVSNKIEEINTDTKLKYTDITEKIIYCLYQGYKSKSIKKVDKDMYKNTFPKELTTAKLNKYSSLALLKNYPKFAFYTENSSIMGQKSFNLVTSLENIRK